MSFTPDGKKVYDLRNAIMDMASKTPQNQRNQALFELLRKDQPDAETLAGAIIAFGWDVTKSTGFNDTEALRNQMKVALDVMLTQEQVAAQNRLSKTGTFLAIVGIFVGCVQAAVGIFSMLRH